MIPWVPAVAADRVMQVWGDMPSCKQPCADFALALGRATRVWIRHYPSYLSSMSLWCLLAVRICVCPPFDCVLGPRTLNWAAAVRPPSV